MVHRMNANLYEQLVGSADNIERIAIETPAGERYSS
jgi:hypothetical protein